jgi:hypothetical protein
MDVNLKLSGPKRERPASAEVPAHAWYHVTDEQLVRENGESGRELIQRGSGRFLGNKFVTHFRHAKPESAETWFQTYTFTANQLI